MWNNFTGYFKHKENNRASMNEARKQAKRAGNEPSEQDQKRVALSDITNNKKPAVATAFVKIDATTKIINGVNSSKVSAEPNKDGVTPATLSTVNNVPTSTQLLAQETLQQKVKPSRDVFCSSSSSTVDVKAVTTTTTITATISSSKDDLMEVESSKPANAIDIDLEDQADPLSTYVNDVYVNLRKAEQRYLPNPNYIESQRDINANMRAILVDWLVEVAEEYKLASETLYLSINYMDRFLSKQHIPRGNLQLLGVVCMLIASKFEEVYAPAVDEFVYISDNTYSKEEVFEMESLVLNVLNFTLTAPTPRTFAKRYLKAACAGIPSIENKLTMLTNYLLELTLLDYSYVKFPPSLTALATVVVALHTLGHPCWTPTIEYYSGYTFEEKSKLNECILEVHAMFVGASKSQYGAIREKYSQTKMQAIAQTGAPQDPPKPKL